MSEAEQTILLLVDDEEVFRVKIRQWIHELIEEQILKDILVPEADSAEEALEMIKNNTKIKNVATDNVMLYKTGVNLLLDIEELDPKPKAILWSSNLLDGTIEIIEKYTSEVEAYSKPKTRDQLLNIFEKSFPHLLQK